MIPAIFPAQSVASRYDLDGLSPSMLFSAGRGVQRLQGADVSIASLLSFSSAQKYTVGQDGNLILNPANGPTYDWSTGRRRLLVEAIPSTNYWLNSEDATQWTVYNGTAANTANGLGAVNLATLTASGSSSVIGRQTMNVSAGQTVAFTAAFVAGSKAPLMTIYDLSVGSVGTAIVLTGPGTLTNVSGQFQIDGTTAKPTIVRVTYTAPAATTLFLQVLSTVGVAGDTIKVGAPQVEFGPGSSYAPSGSSPTTRPADVVTVAPTLVSMLQSGATVAFRATILDYTSGSGVGGYLCSRQTAAGLFGNPLGTLYAYAADGSQVVAGPSGALGSNNEIAAAFATGPMGRRAASFGGSVVGDSKPIFTTADTDIRIGAHIYGFLSNLAVEEFVAWPSDLFSNAAIQAQARTYA